MENFRSVDLTRSVWLLERNPGRAVVPAAPAVGDGQARCGPFQVPGQHPLGVPRHLPGFGGEGPEAQGRQARRQAPGFGLVGLAHQHPRQQAGAAGARLHGGQAAQGRRLGQGGGGFGQGGHGDEGHARSLVQLIPGHRPKGERDESMFTRPRNGEDERPEPP